MLRGWSLEGLLTSEGDWVKERVGKEGMVVCPSGYCVCGIIRMLIIHTDNDG